MATTRIQLSRSAWTNIGTGPLFLQNRNPASPVYWCAAAANPGANAPNDIADLPAHELGGAGLVADVNITLAQPVWARGDGFVVVTS